MEETETAVEQTDPAVVENGTEPADEAKHARRRPPEAQKLVGFIVGAVLIFLAQRDLRRRPPELVRGKVGLWKAVAMVPPGAVVYFFLGRRRATQVTLAVSDSLAA